METVQNAASSIVTTASKLIYGEGQTESGQEPESGSQGQGTANDAFDKGNENDGTTNKSSAPLSEAVGSGGPPNTHSGGAVTESQNPVQKEQGADKPLDEPTGTQQDAVKASKDEGDEAMKKRDPNDHSGESMKMHDGSDDKGSAGGAPQEAGGSENVAKEKGTGEQYVRTTGLAADGGDFDATKPGAGAEANRLLEEKGVHKSEQEQSPADAGGSSGVDGSKAKPKMMEKIKDKLHIGKK